MVTTGYAQVLSRQPSEEIFVLDLVRKDGSRFVTAAGSNQGVREARMRHKAVSGEVSHWTRDGEPFRCLTDNTYGERLPDWRLNERFSL